MTIKKLQAIAARYDVRVERSKEMEDYTHSAHGMLSDVQAFLRAIPVEFRTQAADGVYFRLAR